MNKIKFRAWDVYGKKMYEIEELSFNGDEIDGLLKNDDSIGRVYFNIDCIVDGENEYFILMQFTGKQDKDGNDIYEGDILKSHAVRYDENECQFICDNIFSYLEHESWEKYKVIGNIYQNPELLEKLSRMRLKYKEDE